MLNYEFPPLGGGAGNATYYLLKEFSDLNNIEIDLITSSINTARTERFSKNITIHFLNIGKNGKLQHQSYRDLITYSRKAYNFAISLMNKNKYDFCHAFFGIPCGYIAMKLGIPYIVSLRGSDVPFHNERYYLLDLFIFKNLSKKIWKNSREVIANSEGLRQLALYTNQNQNIIVIPNGIDTNLFSPKKKNKGEKTIIISTGRLSKIKGYEYLIKALKDKKDFVLWLVGEGDLREKLEKLSKKNNINTKFFGRKNHKEIIKLLQKSDLFVMPSLNEGMSNSILEAMACGLPIITTDTGGSKELIRGNGFIVKKANSLELKNAILKYHDKNLLNIHSNISRKLAELMTWKHVCEQYNGVYEKCAV